MKIGNVQQINFKGALKLPPTKENYEFAKKLSKEYKSGDLAGPIDVFTPVDHNREIHILFRDENVEKDVLEKVKSNSPNNYIYWDNPNLGFDNDFLTFLKSRIFDI